MFKNLVSLLQVVEKSDLAENQGIKNSHGSELADLWQVLYRAGDFKLYKIRNYQDNCLDCRCFVLFWGCINRQGHTVKIYEHPNVMVSLNSCWVSFQWDQGARTTWTCRTCRWTTSSSRPWCGSRISTWQTLASTQGQPHRYCSFCYEYEYLLFQGIYTDTAFSLSESYPLDSNHTGTIFSHIMPLGQPCKCRSLMSSEASALSCRTAKVIGAP